MRTTIQWIGHFYANAEQQRIDWSIKPSLSKGELSVILSSLQAWQLGETSDGKNLVKAATLYAAKIQDLQYVHAIKLFIKEEQKHGENLGKYLDSIGKPRIKHDWGDSLFRWVRHWNTSMEMWTLTVLVVESAAQIFYKALKEATHCKLLRQICTDILIDEAYHIDFQTERFAMLFERKSLVGKMISSGCYKPFFFMTALVVWMAHRKLFRAGGNDLKTFMNKMGYKFTRTIGRATDLSYYKDVPISPYAS